MRSVKSFFELCSNSIGIEYDFSQENEKYVMTRARRVKQGGGDGYQIDHSRYEETVTEA